MKKILILLTLTLFCVSADAKKPRTISMSQFVAKNIDGTWYGWYKAKKIKRLKGSVVIVGDKYLRRGYFVKGVFEGQHTAHDLDERLLEMREYRLGRLVHFATYYPNGNLKTDASYDNGGELDGVYTEYYDDGSVMSSVLYANGKSEGDYIVRYQDGSFKSITPVKHGMVEGTVCEWDKEGRLVAVTPMRKDEIHGEKLLYIYNTQNPIKTVETYKDGVIYGDRLGYYILDGDTTTLSYRHHYNGNELISTEHFDTKGELESRGEYVDGEITAWTYYTRGVLTGRVEYSDSRMNGRFVYYHSDGKLWKEGVLTNNKITEEIEYDRDGKIVYMTE